MVYFVFRNGSHLSCPQRPWSRIRKRPTRFYAFTSRGVNSVSPTKFKQRGEVRYLSIKILFRKLLCFSGSVLPQSFANIFVGAIHGAKLNEMHKKCTMLFERHSMLLALTRRAPYTSLALRWFATLSLLHFSAYLLSITTY